MMQSPFWPSTARTGTRSSHGGSCQSSCDGSSKPGACEPGRYPWPRKGHPVSWEKAQVQEEGCGTYEAAAALVDGRELPDARDVVRRPPTV